MWRKLPKLIFGCGGNYIYINLVCFWRKLHIRYIEYTTILYIAYFFASIENYFKLKKNHYDDVPKIFIFTRKKIKIFIRICIVCRVPIMLYYIYTRVAFNG